MESATFRTWLAEHACRFDAHDQEGRAHGHGVVTVRREQRTAILPMLGKHQHLDSEVRAANLPRSWPGSI